MPTYPIPKLELPTWADPERESVFDTLPEKAARKTVTAAQQIAKLLGYDPDDPESSVMSAAAPGTTVVTNTARRIAPKKAIKELVALLKGESKRLGEHIRTPYNEIPENEAKLIALLSSRHGGIPPKPIRLRIDNPYLRRDSVIARDPAVKEAYETYRKTHPGSPSKYIHVKGEATPTHTPKPLNKYQEKKLAVPKPPTGMHDLTKGRSVKVLTSTEMRNMIEGPRKAAASGVIPRDEAAQIIKRNNQIIDDYLERLRELDQERYRDMMEKRLAITGMNRGEM